MSRNRESGIRNQKRLLAAVLFWLPLAAAAADASALFAATLHDLEDKPFALAQLKRKQLIVNLWERWCGPCKKEIPELTAAHDKYARKGLVVVGIALDDKAEATRDFAKAYEMRYTGLLAKEGGIALMQASGNAKAVVPFTLVIDRQGRVIGSKLGAMDHAEIEAAANQLLKP